MGVQRLRLAFLGVGVLWLGACGTEDRPETETSVDVPRFADPPRSTVPGSNANTGNPSVGTSPSTPEMTTVNQLAPTPPMGNPPAPTGMTPQAQTPPAQTPPTQMMPPGGDTNPPAGGASAGCGASQGMPANPTTIADPNTIVTFPNGYDGSQPFPLLFAFHGANRTNTDMRMVDSRTPGSDLEANYVVAFVKSQGTAWDLGADYPRFERLLDQITSEGCIDTDAIFAMGHSSGAQFIVQMLGDDRARETRFAAVAPVSSSLFNNPPWDPTPTLLIHGIMDTARANDLNGAQDISQYARSNLCSDVTQQVEIGTCNSLVRNAAVNPGCKQYQGCSATTLFCNHNDPNYNQDGVDTNHGWPCFANNEIFSFFEATRS